MIYVSFKHVTFKRYINFRVFGCLEGGVGGKNNKGLAFYSVFVYMLFRAYRYNYIYINIYTYTFLYYYSYCPPPSSTLKNTENLYAF
jgi:hypothetical protein